METFDPDAGFADGGTYGVPVNTFPTWRERSILALTNAVRLSPTAYKQSAFYGAGSPSLNTTTVLSATYPARGPLNSQYELNQSSRQHSTEMANFNYFAHNSLDGGSAFQRIGSYYSLAGSQGENIAAGNLDPIATMHQWLCDQAGSACCDDGATCDGHRRNIMSSNYRAVGNGYAKSASSTYTHYWTQDFGGVSSVTVVLADVTMPMAIDLGTASKGTWFVSAARGSGCRPYFFVATDSAGTNWRYPATGQFQTTGEGTCTQEYTP